MIVNFEYPEITEISQIKQIVDYDNQIDGLGTNEMVNVWPKEVWPYGSLFSDVSELAERLKVLHGLNPTKPFEMYSQKYRLSDPRENDVVSKRLHGYVIDMIHLWISLGETTNAARLFSLSGHDRKLKVRHFDLPLDPIKMITARAWNSWSHSYLWSMMVFDDQDRIFLSFLPFLDTDYMIVQKSDGAMDRLYPLLKLAL